MAIKRNPKTGKYYIVKSPPSFYKSKPPTYGPVLPSGSRVVGGKTIVPKPPTYGPVPPSGSRVVGGKTIVPTSTGRLQPSKTYGPTLPTGSKVVDGKTIVPATTGRIQPSEATTKVTTTQAQSQYEASLLDAFIDPKTGKIVYECMAPSVAKQRGLVPTKVTTTQAQHLTQPTTPHSPTVSKAETFKQSLVSPTTTPSQQKVYDQYFKPSITTTSPTSSYWGEGETTTQFQLGDVITKQPPSETMGVYERGLPTITKEQEQKLVSGGEFTKPYWLLDAFTPSGIIKESVASTGINVLKSPIGFDTLGSHDITWANIITAKKTYRARTELESEIGKIGKEFQIDPTKFSSEIGFKATEDKYELGEDYFKTLPSYKKYFGMFDDESGTLKESFYLESLKEAKKRREKATSAANVKLTAGSLGLWGVKTIVGFGEFGASILQAGSVQTIEPGKKNKFWVSFAKEKPSSFLGKVSAMPFTPSTSGFKAFSPSTWKNVGSWAKELPSRPGTLMNIALTTSFIGAGVVGGFKATAIERAGGATKWGARGTVFSETLSGFSPYKISSGIMKTGYISPKEATLYNIDRKGFIDLKISGKPTGWGPTPRRLKPAEIVKSKTLFQNIDTSGGIKYPGEITTGVGRGSEEVFVWGSSKYGWGGVTPSFSGIRIPTVTYIPPITSMTSQPIEGIKGAGRTDLLRTQIEVTKFPIQTSKYGFGAGDKTTFTLQRGGAISIPSSKIDLRYTTGEMFLTEDVAKRTKISYTDVKKGIKYTGDTGLIKLNRQPVKVTATGKSIIQLNDPKEIPEDIFGFKFRGKTLVDKYGKITEGVIYPSQSVSTIKTTGGKSFTEIIKGTSESFIPNIKLGGGGGRVSSISPPPSLSGGGGGSGQSLLSGKWKSFLSQNIYAPSATQHYTPSVSKFSFSIPSPLAFSGKSTQISTPIVSQISTPTKIKPTFTPSPPIIISPPKYPFLTRSKKPPIAKKKTQGYIPQAKSKGGKWVTLSKKPMTRTSALGRASRATDQTLSAQFRVKKAKGKVVKRGDGYFGTTKRKYRPYKIIKGKPVGLHNQFIEKKKYRLDQIGEVRGLSLAKFAKQRGWMGVVKKKIKRRKNGKTKKTSDSSNKNKKK